MDVTALVKARDHDTVEDAEGLIVFAEDFAVAGGRELSVSPRPPPPPLPSSDMHATSLESEGEDAAEGSTGVFSHLPSFPLTYEILQRKKSRDWVKLRRSTLRESGSETARRHGWTSLTEKGPFGGLHLSSARLKLLTPISSSQAQPTAPMDTRVCQTEGWRSLTGTPLISRASSTCAISEGTG